MTKESATTLQNPSRPGNSSIDFLIVDSSLLEQKYNPLSTTKIFDRQTQIEFTKLKTETSNPEELSPKNYELPPSPRGSERFLLNLRPTLVGDHANPHLLPGTGFDVRGMVNKWIGMINKAFIDGTPHQQIIESLIDITQEDLKTGDDEVGREKKVFPQLLQVVDGEILCPRYGFLPYLSTISEKEREGKPLRAAISAHEKLLDPSFQGVLVLKSPVGESGLPDRKTEDGQIIYDDSYLTMLSKNSNGEIKLCTLRTKLNLAGVELLEKAIEFISGSPRTEQEIDRFIKNQKANLFPSKKSTKERTLKTVASPSELIGERASFQQVLSLVEKILGGNFIHGTTTLREAYKDLENFNDLLEAGAKSRPILDTFRAYIEENIDAFSYENVTDTTIGELEEILGSTFLMLFNASNNHLLKTPPETFLRKITLESARKFVNSSEGRAVLLALQQRKGCAGGGGGVEISISPKSSFSSTPAFSSKGGASLSSEKDWKWEPGHCQICDKDRQEVGPCDICKQCNEKIDMQEAAAV